MVLVAIVAVTVLGLVWPWLSICGLRGSLSFTRTRCREGDQASCLLTVRNRVPWGAWGVAVDCGQGDDDTGPDDDLLERACVRSRLGNHRDNRRLCPSLPRLLSQDAPRESPAGSRSASGVHHGLSWL